MDSREGSSESYIGLDFKFMLEAGIADFDFWMWSYNFQNAVKLWGTPEQKRKLASMLPEGYAKSIGLEE